MISLVDRIAANGTFCALLERIRRVDPARASANDAVCVDGLWGSFPPILAGALARQLDRPLLYVTAHLDAADEARDDLELFCGLTADLLSAFETITGQGAASDEIHAERVALCAQLLDLRSSVGSAHQGERGQPKRWAEPTLRIQNSELRTQNSELKAQNPPVIIAPIQALMQAVPTPGALEADLLTLSVGQQRDPQEILEWLVEHGFTRLDQVESPGDFALRGEILDIYPPAEVEPYRIDFFGDQIETIRRFDVSTQRSMQDFASIRIPGLTRPPGPARRGPGKRNDGQLASGKNQKSRETPDEPRHGHGTPAETSGGKSENEEHPAPVSSPGSQTSRPKPASSVLKSPISDLKSQISNLRSQIPDSSRTGSLTSFLNYLPPDTIIAFAEPIEMQEIGRTFWNRLNAPRGMMPVDKVFQRAGGFVQLHLYMLPGGSADDALTFGVQSLTRFETKTPEALDELRTLSLQRDVLLYCDNEPERQRFRELWQTTVGEWPSRLHVAIGLMHRGFDWPGGGLALVGHHEVFHRYQQRRRMRKAHAARPLESWLDLTTGDYVVHLVHGIGRFRGMRTMRKGESGKSEEYLTLEFAEGATMHVPVSQIDLVQKYIGAGGASPPLSKLGGTRWARTKERVEESVSDLAGELLRIQAARSSQPGISYPEDTNWQREFEGSFIYTETEDQLTSLAEIKRDMARQTPMDRLLCGDVGYGKTELAIRAAFKVVEYGRQVAVLVPTTVLAEQHERTFRERMADYPFTIEALSRFKTKKQQDEIVARARKGQVDILIGTHRLLSKDVGFKDLGLLVIDEEQRFGVEHKERLKRFRETVDVLTMSATPIPRTLHMSLLGIRDLSSLATPPLDRRSIVTQVVRWDEKLIREAIVRELNRDGQVYFVHNLVHDITTFADTVQRIVPEARILVGHGQMHEHELENVMIRFIRHEADVLVCTTIIESGLDIPNCNTILIDRADRFGLSELHQLRGRVGRYKHRAYCYLLLSPGRPLTETAAKRLKAIEEYSELGAGFRIAMRDLEIRGAGNILGPEQSGHIAAVGYELYCQLLDGAVRRLKNEPVDTFRPVHLELDVPAHIPRGYIESDRQRMEIYRRLVRCRSRAELDQLEKDIKDAFGPYPPTVQTLLELAEIRILAQPYRIRSISQSGPSGPDLIFTLDEMALLEPVFAHSPGSARIADPHTVHLRLSPAYFQPGTLLAVLRRMLQPQAAVAAASRGGRTGASL